MLRYRLKRSFPFVSRPSSKAEFMDSYREQASLGSQLQAVTETAGYALAVDHFEEYVNAKIRAKSLNQEEAAGIQAVFDYFESGKGLYESASESIAKYRDEPE